MTPTIDPSWRTSDAVALCEAMRQQDDYNLLPILADALQDAGCGDEELLGDLRGLHVISLLMKERLVAIVMSAEGAAAVARIEAVADQLGSPANYDDESEYQSLTYPTLMGAAIEYLTAVDTSADGWGEYLHMGTNENYKGMSFKEFWQDFQLVTGKKVKDDDASFFSCSC